MWRAAGCERTDIDLLPDCHHPSVSMWKTTEVRILHVTYIGTKLRPKRCLLVCVWLPEAIAFRQEILFIININHGVLSGRFLRSWARPAASYVMKNRAQERQTDGEGRGCPPHTYIQDVLCTAPGARSVRRQTEGSGRMARHGSFPPGWLCITCLKRARERVRTSDAESSSERMDPSPGQPNTEHDVRPVMHGEEYVDTPSMYVLIGPAAPKSVSIIADWWRRPAAGSR